MANTTAYQPGTTVAAGEQPGLTALRHHLAPMFDVPDASGYNPRCVNGHRVPVGAGPKCPTCGGTISQHATGLGWDAMTPSSSTHERIIDWALSDDGAAWGVHELISGFSPVGLGRWTGNRGWRPYSGPSNHRDHVHLSITVTAGAQPGPHPPADWTEDLIMALPTLKQGATGEHVETVQHLLTARGTWSDTPANHDGIFGAGTDQYVRQFQADHGLIVDGIVGKNTWTALINGV